MGTKTKIILSDVLVFPTKNISKHLPHYTIMKNGSIKTHYGLEDETFYFNEYVDSSKVVFIGLFNKGNLFNGQTALDRPSKKSVFTKNWKFYNEYDRYTSKQYISLNKLLNKICSIYNIERSVVPSNDYSYKEYGIMSKSNFSYTSYDVNPSFDFKKIEI